MHQRHQHPGAGGGHRVAQGDAAAVDVDLVGVEGEAAHDGHAHRREGLVDLEEVDVVEGKPCPGKGFGDGQGGRHAGLRGVDTHGCPGAYRGE